MDASSNEIYFPIDDPRNPMYWYNELRKTLKNDQTAEFVRAVFENFNVRDSRYSILRFISKRLLTHDFCHEIVRKNGSNIKYVPREYLDYDMYMAAVQENGDYISLVPRDMINDALCQAAVANDRVGHALKYIPSKFRRGRKGRLLYETAVHTNCLAIAYIPQGSLTPELIEYAVKHPYQEEPYITPLGIMYNGTYRYAIGRIPRAFLTDELVKTSIDLFPESIRDVPADFITEQMCMDLIAKNPAYLRCIPANLQTDSLIDLALKDDPFSIRYVTGEKKTLERCLGVLENAPSISFDVFPEEIRIELERRRILVAEKPTALALPPKESVVPTELEEAAPVLIHQFAIDQDICDTFYYISDIHLEHQLELSGKSVYDAKQLIQQSVSELVSTTEDKHATLLIAGDVADSIELVKLFFHYLSKEWTLKIIYVLGNHELWTADEYSHSNESDIDQIVLKYKETLKKEGRNITLLENELLLFHKDRRFLTLSESEINKTSKKQLMKMCKESTMIVLGGLGFSGLNPVYNAAMGLYRAVVSPQEDRNRSKRFRKIYEKLSQCASDLPVIVLTHTPIENWSKGECNSKWIHINGHTHHNRAAGGDEAIRLLADNQIGYKPKRWKFRGFTLDYQEYDPFKSLTDGLHKVTAEQYVDFCLARGIYISGMSYPGDLFAIKYMDTYMFFLRSKTNLCMLEGGRRHIVKHTLDYYFENMPEYIRRIRAAITPYYDALHTISNEVKAFGGSGRMHGCIVDIDFYHHIYLNPFDGKITPYFAWDMVDKTTYPSVKDLLEKSPAPPTLPDGRLMFESYISGSEHEKLPIVSNKRRIKEARIPETVLDTTMYKPNRVMRSLQYSIEQNVIRTWRDELLEDRALDFHATLKRLPQTKKGNNK